MTAPPPTLQFVLDSCEALCAQERFAEALSAINFGLIYFPRSRELIDFFERVHRHDSVYDPAFYSQAYFRSYQSAVSYFGLLSELYSFSSVVDVGAGLGAWSFAAMERSKDVTSIDGEWTRDMVRPHELSRSLYCDLNVSLAVQEHFDLAVCVEVAEHLHPTRSESFVSELCSLSDVIMFGAALPRQGGVGHINCRPHSFWTALFDKFGFVTLDPFRNSFWYSNQVEPWYAQNIFLFTSRKHSQTTFKGILTPSLIDVYHPRVVLDSPVCLEDHIHGLRDPGAL